VHAGDVVDYDFIRAQGYKTECKELYQDNISSQMLIKNGKMSSGKKTKHIKSKLFFIKDRVDNEEIKVMEHSRGYASRRADKTIAGNRFQDNAG
jgi:hypothetical protein